MCFFRVSPFVLLLCVARGEAKSRSDRLCWDPLEFDPTAAGCIPSHRITPDAMSDTHDAASIERAPIETGNGNGAAAAAATAPAAAAGVGVSTAISASAADTTTVDLLLQSISLSQQSQANTHSPPSSSSRAHHSSPRRRKPRVQEVDEDADDSLLDSAEVGEAAVGEGMALPPGVTLRIPLPRAARNAIGRRTNSGSQEDRSSASAHIHKKQKQSILNSPPMEPPAPLARQSSKPLLDTPDPPTSVIGVGVGVPSPPVVVGGVGIPLSSASSGVVRCGPCNKLLSSLAQLADHQQGRRHQLAMQMIASGGALRCEICDKTFNSTLDQSKHLESSGHRANVAQIQNANAIGSPTSTTASANASVASGASSPFTVGGGGLHPFLLQMPSSGASSAVSSPAHHAHHGPSHSHPPTSHSSGQVHFCPLCRWRFPDGSALAHHYAGRKHAAAVAEAEGQAIRLAQSNPFATHAMHQHQQLQWSQHQQLHMYAPPQPVASSYNPFLTGPLFQPSGPPFHSPLYQPTMPHMPPMPYQTSTPYHIPHAYHAHVPSSSDSIHECEEEESQVGMYDDSLAAGLREERMQDEIIPVATPEQKTNTTHTPVVESSDTPPAHAATLESPPSVTLPTATTATTEPTITDTTITSDDAAHTSSTPATSTAATHAHIVPPPTAVDPTVPVSVSFSSSCPLNDDTINSSRKRKYGRYSPVVVNPLARPKLDQPNKPTILPTMHTQPTMHNTHAPLGAHAAHHQPPCACAHQPATAAAPSSIPPYPYSTYPMAPANLDSLSSGSSVADDSASSPSASLAALLGAPPAAAFLPSNSPSAPHPDCRAPHYIFVPYIIRVPHSATPSVDPILLQNAESAGAAPLLTGMGMGMPISINMHPYAAPAPAPASTSYPYSVGVAPYAYPLPPYPPSVHASGSGSGSGVATSNRVRHAGHRTQT